jgi:regulator of protease activity HflC (stomatin/prohibitin superfamily)
MRRTSSFAILVFVLIVALSFATYGISASFEGTWVIVVAVVVGAVVAFAIKVADQWNRAIVLRLGHFHAMRGPGLFLIVPVIDTIAYWIDIRVITTAFSAERTLTKDTVPVNVDAVLFWKVVDPIKAALDVADYRNAISWAAQTALRNAISWAAQTALRNAISWAAQTALRDVIGKTALSDMLEGREKISAELQRIIDLRTGPWGIKVIAVEVKDVLIPPALEDAMSMQAQAERERQARVILGDSERQIAEKFGEAAATYAKDPTAFHLRAMNMLYEGLKQNATIVIVPSTAAESMQLGGIAGLTALTMGLGQRGGKPQSGMSDGMAAEAIVEQRTRRREHGGAAGKRVGRTRDLGMRNARYCCANRGCKLSLGEGQSRDSSSRRSWR